MQKKTVYEYLLKDGKLIKLTHEVECPDGINTVYKIKAGLSNQWRYLYWYEIKEEHLIANHIFSFNDDIDRIRKRLIEHYQNRIQKEEENLERLKNIYTRLQEET